MPNAIYYLLNQNKLRSIANTFTSRYCLRSCGDCGSDQSTAGRAPQPHAAAAAATSAFRAIAAPRWDLYSTIAAHEAMERRIRTSCTSSVKAYNRRTISADGVVGGMREIKIRQLLIDGHTPVYTKYRLIKSAVRADPIHGNTIIYLPNCQEGRII